MRNTLKFLRASCNAFKQYVDFIGEIHGYGSEEYNAAWEVWYGMVKTYRNVRKKYDDKG